MMSDSQAGVVRFEDRNSLGMKCPEQPIYTTEIHFLDNRASCVQASNFLRKGIQKGSQGFRSLRKSMSFQSFCYQSSNKSFSEEKTLDPQGPFMQKWNKLCLISCVVAIALDPLFFYIPLLDVKKQCLKLDYSLETIVCFLRTLTDLFYVAHIILQFCTEVTSPSSRELERVKLFKDHASSSRSYLYSYFSIDILSVLPFPQLAILGIIPRLMGGGHLISKGWLKLVIFTQYIPRLFRMYPLCKEVTQTSEITTESAAWIRASIILFLYMLASHVFGAIWYIYAIDRQGSCWRESCMGEGCHHLSLYCEDEREGNYVLNNAYCKLVGPNQLTDSTVFNFGLFYDALDSEVLQSTEFFEKLLYCYWWGLQNLSSLGRNLNTSTFIGENLLAVFISIVGLVLLFLFIGNILKYLLVETVRAEEMRIRRQDTKQWMSRRMLPADLIERIRRNDQYWWQLTGGVDEESVIRDFPRDLRRDIKRHLCLDLLQKVPLFAMLDEHLKDAICDCIKPVFFTENSFIVHEGDLVNEMLFITRGILLSNTTNGGETGFFNSAFLKVGDICGEELLTRALDSSSKLPISTRTVLSKTEVEAFALTPDDLKFLVSQFPKMYSMRHAFRFYSLQWRTWATRFIQTTWKLYCRRKLKKSLQEIEQYTLANGISQNLGSTLLASRFSANTL